MKNPIKLVLVLLLFFISGFSQSSETCLECHEDEPIVPAKFSQSIHGEMECVDCHVDIKLNSDNEHQENVKKVDCSQCHEEVTTEFSMYQHGKVFSQTYLKLSIDEKFPTCASCHNPHEMLPRDNEASMLNKVNQYKMCNNCHGKELEVNGMKLKSQQAIDEYLLSYHAQNLQKTGKGATCTDCHGAHDISMIRDPNSKTCPCNLDKTCASCHEKETESYKKSIHYVALKAGIDNAPTCSDCHSSHSILPPENPQSPLNPVNAGHYACAKCHSDENIIKRYGLEHKVVSSYEDSYHGLAARRGSEKVASCQDCHGGHEIYPASFAGSSINPKNLTTTCGKCHPDATPEFAASYSHSKLLVEKSVIHTWIQRVYIFLIIAFLLFTFFHNGLAWYYFIRQKMKKIKSDPVVRMTFIERIQHTLLFLSFFTLVITGFALKFPDADWVYYLRTILGTTEETRALIHRIAAVVLILDSFLHIGYVIGNQRGRKLFFAFIPTFKDLVDMIENIKFYLGLRKTQPKFGQFDYTEKIEYWALIWGTAVMVVTGIILWFPNYFSGMLPSWGIRAAELIHYFEAWLATLSIIFYHFFFVIYHPEEYPMNMAWLTGKMHREHYKEKHAGDDEVE